MLRLSKCGPLRPILHELKYVVLFQITELLETNNDGHRIEGIDRDTVVDLINFLVPFEAHTLKLQGKHYPTLPYAVPALSELVKHCLPEEHEDDTPLMKAIRLKCRRLLPETIIITMEHKMATFLWPSYKALIAIPDLHEKEEVCNKRAFSNMIFFKSRI